MLPPRFLRILILSLLILLGISCVARPIALSLPATQPAVTPVELAATPYPTQSPEVYPAPSHSPDTKAFNIVLGRPTASAITASLFSQTDQQITIAYGTQPGNYTSQAGPFHLQAHAPQIIELRGLTANTAYYYVAITNGITSDEHTFHTQRSPGAGFTFTVDADPHNRDPRFNGELYATTLTNVLHDHPDFHINLGDTFMTEKVKAATYQEAESTFTDMRPYFGIFGMEAPLFLVNGNHEGELGWLLKGKDRNLPIWSTQLRQLYYPNPTPGGFYSGSSSQDAYLNSGRDSYFAWTWGDALFVVLDPFWYTTQKSKPGDLNNNWNWTLGKEQYDWLKATLESSRARYKFVFIHHLVGGGQEARGGSEVAPFYEWGGNNADGTYGFEVYRSGWGKPIHQLLVENQVSAVFHGHDHVFVKQELDGIVYQEVPQPSNAEYNNTRIAAEAGYTHGDVLGSSGHLRITITQSQALVEYVRAFLPSDEKNGQQNGQVSYSYIILP